MYKLRVTLKTKKGWGPCPDFVLDLYIYLYDNYDMLKLKRKNYPFQFDRPAQMKEKFCLIL